MISKRISKRQTIGAFEIHYIVSFTKISVKNYVEKVMSQICLLKKILLEEDIFVALALPCGIIKTKSQRWPINLAPNLTKNQPHMVHPWLSLSFSFLRLSWLKNGWWKIKNQFSVTSFVGRFYNLNSLINCQRRSFLKLLKPKLPFFSTKPIFSLIDEQI